MHRLRQSILALILLLSLFITIEHLSYVNAGTFDLQSFVYVLVPIILLTTMGMPQRWHVPAYVYVLVWTAIYVFLKLVLFAEGSPIGTSVVGTLWWFELGVIWLTALFARDLTRQTKDVEDVIEKILLADAGQQPKDLDQAVDDIRKELIRSRRHHHSLSVILIEPEPTMTHMNLRRVVEHIQEAVLKRYMLVQVGSVLSGMLRRTDMVVEPARQGRFVVLCPEIDTAASEDLLGRIRSAVAKTGIKITCGMRTFPNGAVTLDELLEYARSPLSSAPASEAIPSPYGTENPKASPMPVTRPFP